MFTTVIFPDKQKAEKIILNYKKDSKLECPKYRPMSLLSYVDKMLENLMHNWLIKFLTEQKNYSLKQFCLKKNFSTTHAIIFYAIGQKKFAC